MVWTLLCNATVFVYYAFQKGAGKKKETERGGFSARYKQVNIPRWRDEHEYHKMQKDEVMTEGREVIVMVA